MVINIKIMYNSPKNINIAIIGNQSNECSKILEDIINSIKIFSSFKLHLSKVDSIQPLDKFHYIFYAVNFNQLDDCPVIQCDNCSQFFIVVDGCHNLTLDDDDELVFDNDADNKKYAKYISKYKNSNVLHYKISTVFTTIWQQIVNDSSIVNLSDSQIELLIST